MMNKDAGLIDEIEAIRQANDFLTDGEAIDFYEKMKARLADYPPLFKEEEVEAEAPAQEDWGGDEPR
jgi:hypothetical protein